MSTEPTDLVERLERLAPGVDLDRARADLRARQARTTRRRALGTGLAVVCAVAVVTVAVAVQAGRSNEPGTDVSASGRREQPATAADGPQTTTATVGGVELSVTAPRQAVAGTRMWFDVTVRNRGDHAVTWEAGGCAIPVEASIGPVSAAKPDTDDGTGTGTGDTVRWDGDVAGLADWLAGHNSLQPRQIEQPEEATGVRELVCTSDSQPRPLGPGKSVHHRGSVELRVPAGDLADGGDDRLLVDFRPLGPEDARPVHVAAKVTVTDDPDRAGSSGDAVAAFAADPRLASWVASTAVAGRTDIVQDYTTELSWWRGAWELWVEPEWEQPRSLRMRYDPTSHRVVDARTVYLGQAPHDEPGRASWEGEQPDQVL
jgi:hypothetical protein